MDKLCFIVVLVVIANLYRVEAAESLCDYIWPNIPHQSDCKMYYACQTDDEPSLRSCPNGMFFNARLGVLACGESKEFCGCPLKTDAVDEYQKPYLYYCKTNYLYQVNI